MDAKNADEEETDYLRRMDDEKYEQYTIEAYTVKAAKFGTIAIIISDYILSGRTSFNYQLSQTKLN